MANERIGFAVTGSFCTFEKALVGLEELARRGYELYPIMSETSCSTDTRFGKAEQTLARIKELTAHPVIHSIPQAEPLGPKTPLEALVICPCTGNTLAKMANGITDTAVTMAAKAHLRSDRPLVIALASNDALSANLKNIAALLSRKNVYFVPMRQDDPIKKPHSLVADFSLVGQTLAGALDGKQIQPLFVS